MLDKRGRDIGEPKTLVCYAEATPETVAINRFGLNDTLSRIHTQRWGCPRKCTVLYHETKPEGYGIPHGDPPPY